MSLWVTGDCHGDFSKFSSKNFPEGKNLTKNDYIVILGDYGGIWNYKGMTSEEEYWINWLNNKPWTTLILPGNHENFDRLEDSDEFEEKEWHGGIVKVIAPSVLYLPFGYVFNIDGCKCYCMGGASSHDIRDGILEPDDPRVKEWEKDWFKFFRINKVSWWSQEIPKQEEFNRGWKALEENNYKVDFIFSHCASTSTENIMRVYGILPLGIDRQPDAINIHLERVEEKVEFREHHFGHYHADAIIYGCKDKQCLHYEHIERIN